MKIFEEWLDEKSGWDSEHPKYILQFNVGLNVYYKKKTSKNFSFTKLDWNINDYITDNIKEADIQDTPDKFKALKKELEVKYPKVIMYLFPDKKVRLSVTTYYMFKEEQESLYKNEQERFVINEDTSLLAKVFGKKKLQDDLMWDLAKRDIDAHRSTYEEIKAPYSKDKFKPYEYILVRYKDGKTGVFNTGKDEGTRFAYYVSDFRDIDVAVGIKKVAYSKIRSERNLKYINTTNKINDDIIRKYKINMAKFKNNKELYKLEKIAEKYDCVVSSAVWLSPKDEYNATGKHVLYIYISRNDYERTEDIYAVKKYDNEPWEGWYNYGRSETTNITGDWKKMINEIESKIDYTKLPQFYENYHEFKNIDRKVGEPTFPPHYVRPYYHYEDRIG